VEYQIKNAEEKNITFPKENQGYGREILMFEKIIFSVKDTYIFIATPPYRIKIIIFCKSNVSFFFTPPLYEIKNIIFCKSNLLGAFSLWGKKNYFL